MNNVFVGYSKFRRGYIEDEYAAERKVLNAKLYAFYKGRLVIKLPIGKNAFSFGAMFIGNDVTDVNVVRHEYGHTVQLDRMGLWNYLLDVALPSLTIYHLNKQGKLPYDYYSYPWEAEANELSDATLYEDDKSPLPEGEYTSYWDLIKLFFQRSTK